MKKELTTGNVQKTLLLFSGPMILGNLLQQCYNIADTLIVGRFLGAGALAAVGSAYTLMTFLTSVLIGLCMGSGSVFSFYFGKRDEEKMREGMRTSFIFVGVIALAMNIAVFAGLDAILRLLRVPEDIYIIMREYVQIIFLGIFFVFLYNYFSFLLRAVGNSVLPLWFLAVSTIVNIVLDLLCVIVWHMGVSGAAWATVIAQMTAGVGIAVYTWIKEPELRFFGVPRRAYRVMMRETLPEIARFSLSASIQQSVMNFGILMIQGLINSFGTIVMAAFAAAVKIDSFAYMPAQEFSNSFSIFTSQNYGAGDNKRVKEGVRSSVKITLFFCIAVSVFIFVGAKYLMTIFVNPEETEIIRIGVQYLRIEGTFYCGIGLLFLLYAYYRGIGKPEMSVVLTVISLGTRVILAYTLAPVFGVAMIWWAIPIGWFLADLTGVLYMNKSKIGR
ncbi:MAG: MATE family efflux transporter [Lachnospiraceae bacterium]|nr:MATE family efflux transporter [Lachnospiraceae bacterium]